MNYKKLLLFLSITTGIVSFIILEHKRRLFVNAILKNALRKNNGTESLTESDEDLDFGTCASTKNWHGRTYISCGTTLL